MPAPYAHGSGRNANRMVVGVHRRLAQNCCSSPMGTHTSQKPGMLRVCLGTSWGQCSLFLSCSPAHSTDRTSLPTVCLQTASPPLTHWPRPPQALHGDVVATSQPCLDITTEPRERGCSLRLHLSNTGMPKSLAEAEQRSWVHPGDKPEQSAAEFVLGSVCSEHSLCPTEPPWACAVPHLHVALGHPSSPLE